MLLSLFAQLESRFFEKILKPFRTERATQIVLGAVHTSLLRYTTLPTREAHF
jgi:hypothetical protein